MCFWKRNEEPFDEFNYVTEYLRSLTTKDYEKAIKIVEIYRKADEEAKVVELGSKKAVREQEKEEQSESLIDKAEKELEGLKNE